MDRGVWKAAVHGVTEGRTRLSDFTFTFRHWRRKWQPTPVFLPGESQGRGNLVGCRLWGCTELGTTEVTAAAALAVWWLGPSVFIAGASGSVPAQGTKILQAVWCGQK